MSPQTNNIPSNPATSPVQNQAAQATQAQDAWPGATKALGQSNTAIKNNKSPYIFYIVVLAIVEILILVLVKRPASSKITSDQIASLVGTFIGLILLPSLTTYELRLAQGSRSSIKQLFSLGFRKYFNVYVTLIMFIPIFVTGALLIPLIWIVPWFYLVFYAVIDLDYGPVQAFTYVRDILKNNLGKAWAIVGLYVVVEVLLNLLVPSKALGTLLISMINIVFETAIAMLYVWLRKNAAASTISHQNTPANH